MTDRLRERVVQNDGLLGGTPYPTACESECSEPMPTQPSRSVPFAIQIESLNFGYIVRVGCQSFAIESADKLVTALAAYLAEPEKVQRMWFDGSFLR